MIANVFILKERESLQKSLKVTFKKGFRIHVDMKNY